MKSIFKDIIRQLLGWDKVRPGKLSISYWASLQMRENRLDFDTLEDVFRHGRRVTTLVQDYQNYSISISYKWDERKTCYVITSVRLFKREGGEKIMFRIHQSRKPLRTDINIDGVNKITVEEVKEYRQEGFYGRVITIFTTNGEIYCIQLEAGKPEELVLKDPAPDEVWLKPKLYKGGQEGA